MPTSLKFLSPIVCTILYSATVLAQPGFYIQITGYSPSHPELTVPWAPLGSFNSYIQENQDISFTCYNDLNHNTLNNDEALKLTKIEFGSLYTKDATGSYKSADKPTDTVCALALWDSPQSTCYNDPSLIILLKTWSSDGETLHGIKYLDDEGTSVLETQLYHLDIPTPYNAFRIITLSEKDVADDYYGDLDTRIAQWGKDTSSKTNHGNTFTWGFNDEEEEEEVMFDTEQMDENLNTSPTFDEIIVLDEKYTEESSNGRPWLKRSNERPSKLELSQESLAKIRNAELDRYGKISNDLLKKKDKVRSDDEVERWEARLTSEQKKELGHIPAKLLTDQLP